MTSLMAFVLVMAISKLILVPWKGGVVNEDVMMLGELMMLVLLILMVVMMLNIVKVIAKLIVVIV